MIKVIHVLTDTNIGGAGVWLLNYLKSFDRQKYNVEVLLPKNSLLTEKVEQLQIPVFEVLDIADKSFSLGGVQSFIKAFKKLKPDIVHAHASLSARIAAKILGIKTVNTRHCLEDEKKFPKSLIYSVINNYLSDIVIGVSKATCDNLLKDGIKKEKLRLVYNGVYTIKELSCDERKIIKEELSIPQDDLVVGIVARLEDVKNHKMFLKAASQISKKKQNVTFLIVGDGTLKQDLKKMCADLDIDQRVKFLGYIDDITNVMNIIDIITLTSKKEALSLSLIEGMTLGIPTVSTNSGGPGEVIDKGISGIIVENDDIDQFSNAVISLLDDKDTKEKMGKAAKERAKDIFGIDKMNNELEKIYTELTQCK